MRLFTYEYLPVNLFFYILFSIKTFYMSVEICMRYSDHNIRHASLILVDQT